MGTEEGSLMPNTAAVLDAIPNVASMTQGKASFSVMDPGNCLYKRGSIPS